MPHPQLPGKEQLKLNPEGPVTCIVRMHDIVECLHRGIETLFPDSQYFSSAPAKRHYPAFL
jgi:hypothetical protein